MLEKNVPFEHKLIDLNNKPNDFLQKYQLASGSASYGRGLVPLLEHDDNLVIESDAVTKYVAQYIEGMNENGDTMYPTNKEDEELIDVFLNEWSSVTDTYYNVLTATSQKQVVKQKLSYIQSLQSIEKILEQRNDDGDYLLGPNFSYAECIAAPWVQRFYVTLPYFRGINFKEDILLSNNLYRLSNWMEAVCNRPSCMESKCPEEEMIAACKRYYVSFVSPGARGSL